MISVTLKMAGTCLATILLSASFALSAQAQTKVKPPIDVKKPPVKTLPSQTIPLNIPIVIHPQSQQNQQSQQNTEPARDNLQMSCRGPAQKWSLAEVRSGSRVGTWTLKAWYDAAPAGQSQPNAGQCKPYGNSDGFRRYESDSRHGITFRYNAPLRSDPFRTVIFEDGKSEVEFDRDSISSDRNMRFMYFEILNNSGEVFVWAERARSGGRNGVGRVWDIKHVDREHGYRFP